MNTRHLLLLPALLAGLGAGPAWADDDDDYETARRLRASGSILPLTEVLKRLQADFPGRVLETELEGSGKRRVYEIKLLGRDGTVREFKVDAVTGKRLSSRDD